MNNRILSDAGYLIPFQFTELFDFKVVRAFAIFSSRQSMRGGHAHKATTQALQVTSGVVNVAIKTNNSDYNFQCSPDSGVLIVPPMHWLDLYFLQDSTIIVFANELYTEQDYIRNYDEFLLQFTRA